MKDKAVEHGHQVEGQARGELSAALGTAGLLLQSACAGSECATEGTHCSQPGCRWGPHGSWTQADVTADAARRGYGAGPGRCAGCVQR